jgi:hypothetical protein
MMLIRSLALAAAAVALAGCISINAGDDVRVAAPAQAAGPPIAPGPQMIADAEALAKALDGRWTSAEQAKADPAYLDIQTSHVRIWADNPDALYWWYYGESARMPDAAKPYRQNVFQIVPQADGSVFAYQYRVRDPAKAAGFGARGEVPPLTMDDLIAIPNCTVVWRRAGESRFAGSMRGTDCRNKYKNADYMDARSTLEDGVLMTWDRGMTFDGRHVWGPASGGYRFRRVAQP